YGMSQGARGGGVAHVQDVRTDICSMQYLHFRHPWRSYVAVPWMAVRRVPDERQVTKRDWFI
ncbi:MAG: hypothetical protein IMF17_07280, partial [Proteobacteria bacterium]|nr:hypothetical protein [Pseudomonadota bacterium]